MKSVTRNAWSHSAFSRAQVPESLLCLALSPFVLEGIFTQQLTWEFVTGNEVTVYASLSDGDHTVIIRSYQLSG